MPRTVLIVEDVEQYASTLEIALATIPGVEVAQARSGREALDFLDSRDPAELAALVTDLHMPGISGKDAVKLFLEAAPETHIVMLTVSENAEDLLDSLRAGASGYLLKNIQTETLLDSIRRAADGDSVVSVQMTGKLVRGLQAAREAPAEAEKDTLSPREREILSHLARGSSNKEIARNLRVAESTVKIHVQHILRKLNLSSRVQAAVYAIERGLAAK